MSEWPGEPAGSSAPLPGSGHISQLHRALDDIDLSRLRRWGRQLAEVLGGGGRLLAAGNGGSAAQAQHLTSELVGRFRDERQPLSAIALHAETSTVTAVGNDYGFDEVFARQVQAHGRPGDVLVLISASGRSANVVRAARAGRAAGLVLWALTGASPNPLTAICDDALAIAAGPATVQEAHLVAIHLLCAALDDALPAGRDDALAAGQMDPESPAPIVVLGDALLDRDFIGHVVRVSPEAPVPVVDEAQVRFRPGGAALAARLVVVRSRRPVVLITGLSADAAGRQLAELLREGGIRVLDLGLAGPTPVKSRVRADDRTLVMVSQAPAAPSALRRELSDEERTVILSAAAILVADYGGSLAADPAVRTVLARAAARAPVVWDIHSRGVPPVAGARLVTPNDREAADLVRDITERGLAGDIDRGRTLLHRWSAAAVAVTRGSEGAVLLDGADGFPLVVPADTAPAGDSSGAGDCFAATAAAVLADGSVLSEAVTAAVTSASRFVATGDISGIWQHESAASPPSPGPSGRELAAGSEAGSAAGAVGLARLVRAGGGTVVATAGCFDLLHSGHISMLEAARRLGDCLIICLNGDDSVRRLKGENRPIVAARDRAAVLSALACVDSVVIFDEDRPDGLLRQFRPDLYVKGGDYRAEDVLEAPLVAGWGGRTVIVPYVSDRSTSLLIDKITQS
jgi:rfaE bifunctional protein nucleotidyltransferase chain/domain/rfaE bifunctional protein kinase chain/domain